MTSSKTIGFFGTGIGGALLGGAVGAATGAASSATGAAILNACGYPGYDVAVATAVGAAGNAVWLGAIGLFCGYSCKLGFENIDPTNPPKERAGIALPGFVVSQVIGGLIGHKIFLDAGASTLEIAQAAASSATGAAVVGGAVLTLGLIYCIGLCAPATTAPQQVIAHIEDGFSVETTPTTPQPSQTQATYVTISF